MGRCGLNGSDGQQGEDRSGVDPVKRGAAFCVSQVAPDSETRIGAAVWVPGVDVPRFTRPGRGRGRPVVPVTGGRTWTQVRAPNRTHASQPALLQKCPQLAAAAEHPSQLRCELTR